MLRIIYPQIMQSAEDVISITGGAVRAWRTYDLAECKSRGKSRGIYCDTGTERLRQIDLDQNSAGPHPIERRENNRLRPTGKTG